MHTVPVTPPTVERSLIELLPPVPLPRRLSPRRRPLTVRARATVRAAWLHVMDPANAPEPGTGAVVGWSLAGLAAFSYAVAQLITGGAL